MKNFQNIEICKECGGKCCKRLPGSTLPEDFGEPMLENIRKAIDSGKWAVDWWDGDPTGKTDLRCAYFIRPKTKEFSGVYDPSCGGECIFLTESGCQLQKDERPTECRLLEPKKDGYCKQHGGGKRGAAVAWIPFQDLIHMATGETWRNNNVHFVLNKQNKENG